MILTIIFFAIFLYLLKMQTRERATLVMIALFAYLTVISGEQIYLEHVFGRTFHISDPSNYYDEVKNKSFNDLLVFLGDGEYRSNSFYYAVNWFFLNNFINPTLTVLFVKLTNVFVFLSAYLLLVFDRSRVSFIDRLIVFHPFVFLLLIRNVRDAYILFFLALFIVVFLKSVSLWRRISDMLIALMMMLTIRPFFVFLMLCIPMAKKIAAFGRIGKLLVGLSFAFALVILVSSDVLGIQSRLLSAFMSVVSFHEGYDEERDSALRDIMLGGASGLGFVANYTSMVVRGVFVFLFTPHPYNYAAKWYVEETNGMWNIYTDFDNLLIVLGAIVNYLVVFPLVIKFLHRCGDVVIPFVVAALFMLVTYSVFQLGITDPRIKYSFIFIVLLGLKLSGLDKVELRGDAKYFSGSVVLFFAIGLVGR